MNKMSIKRTLLLVIGLALAIPAVPAPASAAQPPKTVYGAQVSFRPAAGYPALPPYPLTLRRTKFDQHNWCYSARLYDASTGIFGPYSASRTPPILPTDPGLDGGDNCIDPATSQYAIETGVLRAPNLYGTFGPITMVEGMKLDPAVRRLRLNLPDGSTVHLPVVKGTFLWATNSQLPPFSITLTYRLNGVDTTTSPL